MNKNFSDRLCLGTAQFGLDYGIANRRGKIPKEEVFEILTEAIKFGIDTVDTAYDYGESEEILGNFVKHYHGNLKIISKLPKCEHNEVEGILDSSLKKLGISAIYGYLIHNFESYKEDRKIWDELERLKSKGRTEKIGFSIYYPQELESLFKDGLEIDIIQIPLSIFDQRFNPYFSELRRRNVEIYTRSVFLQGLVFKNSSELDTHFQPLRTKMEQLNLLARGYNIPIFALCLNFPVRNEFIDKIVVGVDNLQHLEEIMRMPDLLSKIDRILPQLYGLRVDDESLILPFNWNINEATL